MSWLCVCRSLDKLPVSGGGWGVVGREEWVCVAEWVCHRLCWHMLEGISAGDLLRRERTLNAAASSPHVPGVWPRASQGRAGVRDEISTERKITFLLVFRNDESGYHPSFEGLRDFNPRGWTPKRSQPPHRFNTLTQNPVVSRRIPFGAHVYVPGRVFNHDDPHPAPLLASRSLAAGAPACTSCGAGSYYFYTGVRAFAFVCSCIHASRILIYPIHKKNREIWSKTIA